MSLLPSKPDAEPPDDAGPRVIGVNSEDADDVLAALSSGTARELLNELHEEPAAPSMLADTVDTSVQNVKYHLDKLENAGAIEVVDTAYSEKGREMDVYAAADQPLVIYAGDEEKGSTLRTALSRLLGAVGILAVASFVVQAVFEDGVPWADDDSVVVDDPDAVDDTDEPAVDDAEEPPEEPEDAPPEEPDDALDEEPPADDEPGIAEEPEPPEDEEEDLDAEATGDDVEIETADGADLTAADNETFADNATTPEESPVPGPDAFESATEAAGALPPGVLFFAGGVFVLALAGGWFYLQRR